MGLKEFIKKVQIPSIKLAYTDSEFGDFNLTARLLNVQDNLWVDKQLDTTNPATINATVKLYRLALAIWSVDDQPVYKFLDLDLKKQFGIEALPEDPYKWPFEFKIEVALQLAVYLQDLPQEIVDTIYLQYETKESVFIKSTPVFTAADQQALQAAAEARAAAEKSSGETSEGTEAPANDAGTKPSKTTSKG